MVGKTISHYEVVEKLGEGGMGTVYKARDSHLDRFVAIKVISSRAIANPENQLRFVQEAKSASALNHPNIITVYDIENTGELAYIVMEFIDGKTLAELIGHKGVPVGKALHYAVQIADALATAHRAGIVHRDIKPVNIMITAQDLVKVLDFGLAKLATPSFAFSESASTATIPAVHTDEGIVLGTASYMSPEQAQGAEVDARSDIFSFGAVLYEMITGQRAFSGENKLSILAAILNKEPRPAGQIVEGLPHEVERITALCLRKDPARRLQHMEDLKIALEELKEESDSGRLAASARPAVPVHGLRRLSPRLRTALVAVLLIVLAGANWLYLRSTSKMAGRPVPAEVARGRLTELFSSELHASHPALSPDGKMIAYVAEADGRTDLFVCRVAGGTRVRLTNDDARKGGLSFSPDGERILFTRFGSEARSTEVWVVPVLGGEARSLVENAMAGTWSPDGAHVAFISRRKGAGDALAIVTAEGTDLHILMSSDGSYPFFQRVGWSPDGATIVASRSSGGIAGELWLVPLSGGSPRRLSSDPPGVFSADPVFTTDGRGILHSSNRGGATNLWIQNLDSSGLVQVTTGPGPDESPTVARDGSVAFANPHSRTTLIVHDFASGQTRDLVAHSSPLWAPAFAPDGREVAFSRSERDGSWHIWIASLQSGAARRLTSGTLPEIYPRFSPDGSFVVYQTWSRGPDRIWRVPRRGGAAVALTPVRDEDDGYGDISPDGHWLAFARTEKGITRIYVSSLSGGEAKRLTDSDSTVPHWSPDGRWIAFSTSRGLTGGVWVIAADGTRMRRLSETGGWPVWWPNGKKVGYLNAGADGSEQILTVGFEGGPSAPLTGVRLRGSNNAFDVSSDGRYLTTSNSVEFSSEIWLLKRQP